MAQHTSMLIIAISVPAAGRQAVGCLAHQNARVPLGYGLSKLPREVGAAVDDPPHSSRTRRGSEDTRAQGRVAARTSENVFYWRFGRGKFDLI